MSRLLTIKEIEVLEMFTNSTNLHHTKLIKDFIRVNSYQPKYNVDDCVKVVDRSCRIRGKAVNGLAFKIEKIYWFIEKDYIQIVYSGTAIDEQGGKHMLCADERSDGKQTSRYIIGKAEDNINNIDGDSSLPDSLSI